MALLPEYLRAAYDRAGLEQQYLLRSRVLPLLRGTYLETGDESEVRDAVREIMGPDWGGA